MAKDNFIRLRVAGWEKDYIQRKATSANLTLSEFVRRAAMHQKVNVLSGTDEEVLQELCRQGNNLNQLTSIKLEPSFYPFADRVII